MTLSLALRSASAFSILLFSLLSLSACDEMGLPRGPEAAGDTDNPVGPYYPQLAPIAPPMAKIEAPPVLSDPQHTTWRAGYWEWNGSSFDWVPGEVIASPSMTAVWRPSFWIQHTYGWAYVPGYWQ